MVVVMVVHRVLWQTVTIGRAELCDLKTKPAVKYYEISTSQSLSGGEGGTSL